jgi:endoglucanase
MINFELLKEICRLPGAPGHESKIRSFIKSEVGSFVDTTTIDNLGNLIAFRKGRTSKKLMIAAHMDEISLIVTHIDEEGFIRFHTLGGFDAKTLTAQRVIIHGIEDVIGVLGTKPIHAMTAEEKVKPLKTSDFFIDTGMTKSEVLRLIGVGDVITRERSLIRMGNCLNSKSLDNRISVYILLETLKQLKSIELPIDVYGVFTVQEEVGLRGATTASSCINPDFGIGLDVTLACDVPAIPKHEVVTKLGYGTAIKVMDSSAICDYRMVAYMKDLAQKKSVKYQLEVLQAGGTDTGSIQRNTIGGAITGAISIPTRYLHQVIEMVHEDDVQSTIDLLKECILNISDYNWEID